MHDTENRHVFYIKLNFYEFYNDENIKELKVQFLQRLLKGNKDLW